jgi:thioredoxin-like negative regulator of GroEL
MNAAVQLAANNAEEAAEILAAAVQKRQKNAAVQLAANNAEEAAEILAAGVLDKFFRALCPLFFPE